ncbi:MAG: DUF2066 domain-containing protein, partial [Pseudomonas sp.]|nr:DUF2066 domain-containing protein [Pseudomonas sp.]
GFIIGIGAALIAGLFQFGGQLVSVDGNRIVYQVNGSAEQLRSQLALAQMHEVPADQASATPQAAQLRFSW